MGMSGPQSETHEDTWNDEECGHLECDTATDGIRPDGATSQDRASPVTVSPFSPLGWKMRDASRSETFGNFSFAEGEKLLSLSDNPALQ